MNSARHIMNRSREWAHRSSHFARMLLPAVLCALVSAAPAPQEEPIRSSEEAGPAPRLRVPWEDRAIDFGVQPPNSIRVVSDVEREHLPRVLERIALLRSLGERMFGSAPLIRPDLPQLLLFESPEEMRFTLRTAFGVAAPSGPALAVSHSSGPVLAVTSRFSSPYGLERALQAEAFHQYLIPRCSSELPPWARAGLAEYFGAIVSQGARWRSGHCPPDMVETLQRAQGRNRLVPFDRLLQLDQEGWTRFESVNGPELMQAQAWSLVQFMLHGGSDELTRRFGRWLERVCAGNEPIATFRRLMTELPGGSTMAGIDEAWQASLSALEPSAMITARERAELLREGLDRLERQGVRPEDPRALCELISNGPLFEHVVRSHPYQRALDSHDSDLLDPESMVFLPVSPRPVDRRRGRVPSPPRVRFVSGPEWTVEIVWDYVDDSKGWFPRVEIKPRQG